MKSKILGMLHSQLTPLLLGLAMVAVVPIGFAKQADAAWGCASGYVCFYTDANYSGDVLNYSISSSGGCYNVGSQFNDRISSVHNYLSHGVQLFENINCNNVWLDPLWIPAGISIPNIANTGPMNDQTSSFKVI